MRAILRRIAALFLVLTSAVPSGVIASGPAQPRLAEGAPPPTAPPNHPPSRWQDRLYFGGNVGASFGDVDYVSISPIVGYSFTPRVSAGAAVTYAYRNDSRYTPELSTSDYGLELFTRYRPAPPFFLEARYSHWNYEVPLLSGGTTRDSYNGYLAGGGYVMPMGSNASFAVSALYDFNYDDDSPSPYDDPWVISAGVMFGF